MDESLKNTPALLKLIDLNSGQLLKRYMNLVSLVSTPATTSTSEDDDPADPAQPAQTDLSAAALNTLKFQTETQALIRAAEELLRLSRQMKETWLFGKLDTLRQTPEEGRWADTAAAGRRAVLELLQKPGAPSESAEFDELFDSVDEPGAGADESAGEVGEEDTEMVL